MLTADGHEITKGMTVYENPKSGTGLKALVVVARPGAGAMFVSCRTAEGRLLCRRNPSHLLVSPAAARGDADGAVTA